MNITYDKNKRDKTLIARGIDSADFYDGEKLVKRGRPVADSTKTPISLRLDDEILEAFKATGKGWQTRINNVLKEWVEQNHT